MLRNDVIVAFKISLIFLIIAGVVFPLALTGVAQVSIKQSADGSLIERNGTVIGSSLVGQNFSNPKYFQSRLGNIGPSGVSNWGPYNPDLIQNVSDSVKEQRLLNNYTGAIPIDLVTRSGSGQDPNIAKTSALFQIPRISNLTGISQGELKSLVDRYTEERFIGIFGEPRVNVLQLNLALDNLIKSKGM